MPSIHPALRSRCGLALAVAAMAAGVVLAAAREGFAPATAEDAPSFTNFETEAVRPLALAPDGARLYAVNTADDRLEIFDVTPAGLARVGEVAVGLRPVAVALRGADEAWVVNHLSDSVSRVDVSDPARARVTATVRVGDEPRDVVVAGPDHDRVFVATAYRGEELTPGIGRGSVWVIDARDPAAPPREVRLFGTKARALAASSDGRTVYAAIFHSGNGTTVIGEDDVEAGGGLPSPRPANTTGQTPPPTGLIVAEGDGTWVDETGKDWRRFVPFTLPDKDVFAIDAAAPVPAVVGAASRVGGTLFNLAPHPGTGEVWVTNTDPGTDVRFEPNLRGHAVNNQVTRIAFQPPGSLPRVAHLNPHIDRGTTPGAAGEIAASLAQPTDIVFGADGMAYVAAFGSRKVAVLDGAANVVNRIDVGFGPAGLAVDDARRRLYVLNHLDATISVIDLAPSAPGRGAPTLATVPLRFDPTPADIEAGRPFLYDAALTSGHGDMSCASCHVFADRDHVAWDLGDPTGKLLTVPLAITHDNLLLKPRRAQFHPMKGPMTTQSLRGLAGTGPMHWRGDRFGAGAAARDEVAAFKQFNGAFVSLNGRGAEIGDADMTAFARFVLTIRYPPNPTQPLDRAYTGDAKAGFEFFTGPVRVDQGVATCQDCHALPTGSNGRVNFEGDQIQQDFKAAHLRNLYDKVGRFDAPGNQVSGFGFVHDGSFDTLETFLELDVFRFPGRTEGERAAVRRQLVAYLMQFDTGMAPAVGQQVTVGAATGAADRARLDVIVARARAGDCDLVARGQADGRERGYLLDGAAFWADREGDPPVLLSDLVARGAVAGAEVTFTCVPPGDGERSALDRDGDGHRDGDEIAAGSDPADPSSGPGDVPTATASAVSTVAPSVTPSATAVAPTRVAPTPLEPTPTAGPGRFTVWLPIGRRE